MRLVYVCKYDGEMCDKEVPKVDEKGFVVPPKEYENPRINCKGDWEICMSCDRNLCASGTCHGNLKIVNC